MFGYVYQETSRRGKRNRGSLMNVSSRLVGCAVLKKLEKSALEASKAKKNEEESMGLQEAPTVTRFHRILRLFYVIFAVIVMILIVILSIAVVQFFTILRIFYGSIIMWRGAFKFQVFLTLIQNTCDFRLCSFCCDYFLTLLLLGSLPFNFTVIEAIQEFVKGLHFKEIEWLFTPFIYVYKAISSFQINFGGIEVTCVGSQFPLFLCIDIAVFTLCLSVTCSDFQLFSDTFSNILSYWSSELAMSEHPFFDTKFRDSVAALCSSSISYLFPEKRWRECNWLHFPYYAASYSLWASGFILVTVLLVVFDAMINVLLVLELFFRFSLHHFATLCRKLLSFALSFTPLQR